MRSVGLNFRMNGTMLDLIYQAQRLNIPLFQTFLTHYECGSYIQFKETELSQIHAQRSDIRIIAHGSYKINLASVSYYAESCYFLKKELELASQLASPYLIMHPGSVENIEDFNHGIDIIAKKINTIFKKNDYPTLVLENVAFNKRVIGGDITHLAAIRDKLDKPEKIKFCIDTAHAYSYGYNIADPSGQKAFIELLETVLGFESIVLIHLNDTQEQCGSFHDRHDIPGNGAIGLAALKQLINHERLKQIPLIMELPLVTDEELNKIVLEVQEFINR